MRARNLTLTPLYRSSGLEFPSATANECGGGGGSATNSMDERGWKETTGVRDQCPRPKSSEIPTARSAVVVAVRPSQVKRDQCVGL